MNDRQPPANIRLFQQLFRFVLIVWSVFFLLGCANDNGEESCATSTYYQGSITDVINQYRMDNGLKAIPFSPSLTYVAEYHIYDLVMNNPVNESCNLHSWSDKGEWSPCCFSEDIGNNDCMTEKPGELTPYPAKGFEIAVKYQTTITPNCALESWRKSPDHHKLILNLDEWAGIEWKAIGGAISKHYAVIWFGEELDPVPPNKSGRLN